MKSRGKLLGGSLALLTLAAASLMSVAQPAKADIFCWPGERGCKVDGRPGSSGNGVLGNARDGFIITVSNRTGTRIRVEVLAYYSDPGTEVCSELYNKTSYKTAALIQPVADAPKPNTFLLAQCAEAGWKTFGTWDFAPGERSLILNGKDRVTGRYATFKARAQDGRVWEKKVDMGSKIGRFEFTFG